MKAVMVWFLMIPSKQTISTKLRVCSGCVLQTNALKMKPFLAHVTLHHLWILRIWHFTDAVEVDYELLLRTPLHLSWWEWREWERRQQLLLKAVKKVLPHSSLIKSDLPKIMSNSCVISKSYRIYIAHNPHLQSAVEQEQLWASSSHSRLQACRCEWSALPDSLLTGHWICCYTASLLHCNN